MLYGVARRVVGTGFRLVWRPQIIGLTRVPRSGPVVLASNHLSFSDSVIVPALVPRRVTFLAKSEYFTGRGIRGKVMAAWFDSIGAVPVKRTGSGNDAMDALNTALDVLKSDGAFALYPEGTRSRDGRLYRGRTGVAWLALASGAPIVPVGLSGTDRLQPVGARLPRLAKITVEFGEPIDPAPYAERIAAGTPSGRVRRELTDAVMDSIAAMTGQPPVGAYNTPPADEAATPAI